MGIQLSKLVSTRHRLANSGPALQSRMQRDITSFTCNIAELDDNVPARDQTKRSVLRKQHAKDSGVPPLPFLPLSPEGNSNDRVGALGLQDSISKAASSHNISWDIPPSSQVLYIGVVDAGEALGFVFSIRWIHLYWQLCQMIFVSLLRMSIVSEVLQCVTR